MNGYDLIDEAFTEINVKEPDQPLETQNVNWGQTKLNRLLDTWKTRRLYAFCVQRLQFALAATQDSYTIGRSGAEDFTADRPVKIEKANIVLMNSSPYLHIPLNVVTFEIEAQIGMPGITSTYPSTLYYQPTDPDGTLWLYPKATETSSLLELWVWNQLSEITDFTASFTLPPGYRDAIVWNLAETLLAKYPNEAAASEVKDNARKSRVMIQSLNSKLPRIPTMDSGVPSGNGRRGRGWFYYQNGNLT